MATFVLTGLSTQKASQEAQKNLREALGGKFYIAVELSESNPYFRMVDDGEGALDLYTELPITQDMVNAIMTMRPCRMPLLQSGARGKSDTVLS